MKNFCEYNNSQTAAGNFANQTKKYAQVFVSHSLFAYYIKKMNFFQKKVDQRSYMIRIRATNKVSAEMREILGG